MSWVSVLVILAAALYFASTLAFLGYVLRFTESWAKLGTRVLWAGVVLHGIAVAHLFALDAGEMTVEKFSFSLGLIVSCSLLAIERREGGKIWSVLLSPLATVLVLASIYGPIGEISSTTPDFIAVITPVHIASSVFGILAFLAAFIASVMFVAQDYALTKKSLSTTSRLPPQVSLYRWSSRALIVGFPLYTIGIVLGAMWAIQGTPPEFSIRYLLALLSWLVYGLLILGKFTRGWSGRKAAILTMVGFLCSFTVLAGYFARGGGA